MRGVVTRIIPKGYNGIMLSGSEPWVDSPIINNYPTIYTKVVEFPNIALASDVEENDGSMEVYNTLAEVQNALTEASRNEFNENEIDKPTVSIECQMVLLQNTAEYKDYANLESVTLGDTVHLKHRRLGIESTARIVSLSWDCIRKAVTDVSIGAISANIMDRIASSVTATEKALTKDGNVLASQINGIINGANARIIAQASSAGTQKEKVILFEDLDPESETFGAMALGTTGFVISDTRNATNTDWIWSTFGTGKGFSADLITAGTLSAINIIGSIISGSTIISEDGANKTTITSGKINTKYEFGTYRYSGELGGIGLVVKLYDSNTGNETETQITNAIILKSTNNNKGVLMTPSSISVEKPDGSKTTISSSQITIAKDDSNYVYVGTDNIYVVKNGSIVWRAIS